MKQWRVWVMVGVLAVTVFTLIHLGMHASNLDRLFREQVPVGEPGRPLVVLAVVAPFTIILVASLLASAIPRSSTAATYGGAWLVYSSLLSQALLSMSGAFLLIFPLTLPAEAMTRWLHPDRWHLPVHYTSTHEPVVIGLISVGFALIVIGLVEVLRARRQNHFATEGLYATIRHPQHLGIILWTLGFALWGASPIDLTLWFMVSYVFVCLGMHEERKLIERFDGEYQRYQQRVMFMPPFVPFRGPIHIDTGRQLGLMVGVLVLGIAAIMGLFYLVAIPAY